MYVQQTGGKGKIIWILNKEQPIPEPLEERGYWDIKTVTAGTKGWKNSWNCHQMPVTMQRQSSWQIGTWITGKYRSEREKWSEQMWAQMETSNAQDNLYQCDEELSRQEWMCQMCMLKGRKMESMVWEVQKPRVWWGENGGDTTRHKHR